jgi:D-tyrosyl-tRNA(Tyr) deacylase
MRAVIQRVQRAEVRVGDQKISEIGTGIMTLLGIFKGDQEEPQLKKLIQKICELRIFEDENGKMNRSLLDCKGSHLIVSQFTLAGDTSGGRRPSFVHAESPDVAKILYERALAISAGLGVPTFGGVFQADMKVEIVNDGPVTFVLDV